MLHVLCRQSEEELNNTIGHTERFFELDKISAIDVQMSAEITIPFYTRNAFKKNDLVYTKKGFDCTVRNILAVYDRIMIVLGSDNHIHKTHSAFWKTLQTWEKT